MALLARTYVSINSPLPWLFTQRANHWPETGMCLYRTFVVKLMRFWVFNLRFMCKFLCTCVFPAELNTWLESEENNKCFQRVGSISKIWYWKFQNSSWSSPEYTGEIFSPFFVLVVLSHIDCLCRMLVKRIFTVPYRAPLVEMRYGLLSNYQEISDLPFFTSFTSAHLLFFDTCMSTYVVLNE